LPGSGDKWQADEPGDVIGVARAQEFENLSSTDFSSALSKARYGWLGAVMAFANKHAGIDLP
jgi:hypothetical protein